MFASVLNFSLIGDLFQICARSCVSTDSFLVDVFRFELSLRKVTDFLIFNLFESFDGHSW